MNSRCAHQPAKARHRETGRYGDDGPQKSVTAGRRDESGEREDRLFGDAGADVLLGGAGDDLLLGGGGDDHLAGDDSGHAVPQSLRALAYRVAHEVTTDAEGNRSYTYAYSTVNDVVRQGGGDDALYGGAGNDVLDARKSQSPGYGGCAAANDCEWRWAA